MAWAVKQGWESCVHMLVPYSAPFSKQTLLIAKTLSFISAKLPLEDVQTMPGAQKTAVLPGGRVSVAMPWKLHRKAAREVNAKHAHAPRPKALNVRTDVTSGPWWSKVHNYPDLVWGRRVKDWKKWSFVQSCRQNVNSRTRLWKHERGRALKNWSDHLSSIF